MREHQLTLLILACMLGSAHSIVYAGNLTWYDTMAINHRKHSQLPYNLPGYEAPYLSHYLHPNSIRPLAARRVFETVSQVYSWRQGTRADYTKARTLVIDGKGKFGIFKHSGGELQHSFQSWDNTTSLAREEHLTGICWPHEKHYSEDGYLLILCYNQKVTHNTLTQPMVYDYYVKLSDTTAVFSGQNFMNGTDSSNDNDPMVDFNHRLHANSYIEKSGTNNVYWSMVWNGPNIGHLDPISSDVKAYNPTFKGDIFFRPHNDFNYLKRASINGGMKADLKMIIDVVQPTSSSPQKFLFITYVSSSNTIKLGRCDVDNVRLKDNTIPQRFVQKPDGLTSCESFNTGALSIARGSIKYIPNSIDPSKDIIIGVDMSGDAPTITRCNWDRTLAAGTDHTSSCIKSPVCSYPGIEEKPTPKTLQFAYFSDCRTTDHSCGIYYTLTKTQSLTDLSNTIQCVDMLQFNGNPVKYSRYFPESTKWAFDIDDTVQYVNEQELTSIGMDSIQEQYINPKEIYEGSGIWADFISTRTTNIEPKTYELSFRSRQTISPPTDIDDKINFVVKLLHDFNDVREITEATGYSNHYFRLPVRRDNWVGNAISCDNNLDTNAYTRYTLHLNDYRFNFTDGLTSYDAIPMGEYGVRITYKEVDNLNRLDALKCTEFHNSTLTGVCTRLASIDMKSKAWYEAAYGTTTIPFYRQENIKQAWNFQNFLVVYAYDSGNNIEQNTDWGLFYIFSKQRVSWQVFNASDINDPNFALENIESLRYNATLHYYDATEYGGDIYIATKYWNKDKYGYNPVFIHRVIGGNTNDENVVDQRRIPDSNFKNVVKGHPTGEGPQSIYRYFPLENDNCVTGVNFVHDNALKVRILIDCKGTDYPQKKYLVDWSVFNDKDNLLDIKNSYYAFNSDKFYNGCSTGKYTFWISYGETGQDGYIFAYDITTKSKIYFNLPAFGVVTVEEIMCVEDYVVVRATGAGDTGMLLFLYATKIEDASRRIHSKETFTNKIQGITATIFQDRVYVRMVLNDKIFFRVAYMDGPSIIVRSNSNDKLTVTHICGNGITPSLTKSWNIKLSTADNSVSFGGYNAKAAALGTYNIYDLFNDIKGHTYEFNVAENTEADILGTKGGSNDYVSSSSSSTPTSTTTTTPQASTTTTTSTSSSRSQSRSLPSTSSFSSSTFTSKVSRNAYKRSSSSTSYSSSSFRSSQSISESSTFSSSKTARVLLADWPTSNEFFTDISAKGAFVARLSDLNGFSRFYFRDNTAANDYITGPVGKKCGGGHKMDFSLGRDTPAPGEVWVALLCQAGEGERVYIVRQVRNPGTADVVDWRKDAGYTAHYEAVDKLGIDFIKTDSTGKVFNLLTLWNKGSRRLYVQIFETSSIIDNNINADPSINPEPGTQFIDDGKNLY